MRMTWQILRSKAANLALGTVLLLCLPVQSVWAAAEKRVALVIGNGAYKSAIPLDNPVTDAKAVSAALKRLGFEVVEGYDLGTSEMRSTLSRFSAALPDAKAAMVYYAGHGVSVDDENFLIPTDLSLKSQTDLDLNALSLSLVLKQMKREERVNVVILDACRDNPFAADLMRGMRSRSAVVERGLSRVDTDLAKGTLIAFATDPRSTALDGKAGDNSPFTKALLRHIEEPGVSIDTVMTRVRADVWEATKQKQMPWVNTSIIGEFILNPAATQGSQVASLTPGAEGATAAVANPAAERLAQENKMWDSAERGNAAEDYQAYLNGVYAGMARARVNRLKAPAQTVATAAAGATAVAALAPAAPTEATRAAPVNEPFKAEVTSAPVENKMNLKQQARKEVQQRLIALGYDAGTPNSTFTAKTRNAIGAWQQKNDLPQTKYLGPLQRQALLDQSEQAWKRISMLKPDPAPAQATRKLSPQRQAAPVRRAVPRQVVDDEAPAPRRTRQQPQQQANPNFDGVGAFIGGMAVGGALGGFLRH
jgi:uncharacterized caspase-like protein